MSKAGNKKPRTVANPCLSVADLVAVFNRWLLQSMSKDIFALLRPSTERGFTWKTAPDHQWLNDVSSLFVCLVDIVPNTVVTSKKLILAFESLHKDGKTINTSKMSDTVFHEWCDQTIQIIFCKYREIKNDSQSAARVYKRCIPKQQEAISMVVSKIVLTPCIVDSKNEKNWTLSPPKSWGSWPSGVGKAGSCGGDPSVGSASSSSTSRSKATEDALAEFSSVFKQVLLNPEHDDTKRSKEEVQPEVGLSESFIADAKISRKLQSLVSLGKWKMADQRESQPCEFEHNMRIIET